MKILNESFMESSILQARAGLLTTTKTNLLPHISLYRFASSKRPDLYYTGPWWIGFTPFEALKHYAKLREQSISMAARQCLAIDWEWSNVDVLVRVLTKNGLAAWSGTPKTQVPKGGASFKGIHWEPDRDITQLFIPGLGQPDPNESKCNIWQSVFICHTPFYLSP